MIILQISDRYAPRGPLDAEYFITIGIIILIIIIVIVIVKISNFFSDINKEVQEAKNEWNKLSPKEQEEIRRSDRQRRHEHFYRKIKETFQVIFGLLIIFIFLISTIIALTESFKINELWGLLTIILPITIFLIGYKIKKMWLIILLAIVNITYNFIIVDYSGQLQKKEKFHKEQLIKNEKIIKYISNLENQLNIEARSDDKNKQFNIFLLKHLIINAEKNYKKIYLRNSCINGKIAVYDKDSLKYSSLNSLFSDNLIAKNVNEIKTLILLSRHRCTATGMSNNKVYSRDFVSYEFGFFELDNSSDTIYYCRLDKDSFNFNIDNIDIINSINSFICN